MAFLLNNLIGGVKYRIKKTFHRPYAVFDIGWFKEKRLKHQADSRIKHHLYRGKYKIVFRDAIEFLVSIEELFINEFYKFRPVTDRPKIIDCGSYIGTSILYFKVNYPNAIVTGFEPDPSNYSLLERNLDSWAFTDTKVINAAIWTDNDGISFNSTGNMSSRIDMGVNETDGMQRVRSVRLSELLNEEIDFLKIDIEGAELPVLRDCSDKLRNVRNLFVEYHGKFANVSELNEILDILLRNDFKYCIKEGSIIHSKPFWDKDTKFEYDLLLNIFAFRV
ncbi:MAG TPA: FkbM family methyltransferase [Puia sp.]|nr:FkbM family methyltransferase [Puia sp.]